MAAPSWTVLPECHSSWWKYRHGIPASCHVLVMESCGQFGCGIRKTPPVRILNTEPFGCPMPNRLIHEKSPYLLQHAHNPVDWFPWGEEAFAKARTEEK